MKTGCCALLHKTRSQRTVVNREEKEGRIGDRGKMSFYALLTRLMYYLGS